MRLFSYIVARDYGFAPNPFHGFCSIAACKPNIRRVAEVGDIILGTGSARHDRAGFIVFIMRVTEKLTFAEFWYDPRFLRKRPDSRSSQRQAYGDNIYRPDGVGGWIQLDSHHSLPGGQVNLYNLIKDTGQDSVLVSNDYAYWGACGPAVPQEFRDHHGYDIVAPTQGHVSRFPMGLVDQVDEWFRNLETRGYRGRPREWS